MIGQPGDARASAILSDGTTVDVTWLAAWTSSAPAVAAVDAWGRLDAVAAGNADITAAIAGAPSQPLALTVVERPTLQKIIVENVYCQIYAYPDDDPATGEPKPLPPSDAFLPPPYCQQVVRIGGTLQFRALGQFDNGYYDDITDEVTWAVDPPAVGTISAGTFTGVAAGAASLTATLGDVHSDAQSITVVDHASIVTLSVYPGSYPYQYVDGGPVRAGRRVAVLRVRLLPHPAARRSGPVLRDRALRHRRVGGRDGPRHLAEQRRRGDDGRRRRRGHRRRRRRGGDRRDRWTASPARRPPCASSRHATLQNLSIYMDGADRAIASGAQAVFHAIGFYDVGFDRSVSDQVTWHSSDETVGGFDAAGVFTGRAAGTVTVWAELEGLVSQSLPLEVYAVSELEYCDAAAINRGTWSDDFNRVTLESDCATYTPPDVVELRFSVTETQRPGGIFDPCLDLYAYQGDRLVRTIREEGCGDPFLAPAAPERDEAALRYQLKAFWDLKDSDGATVAPGEYEIRGRFYLYYDPVVTLKITVD